jgi:hypothetical protein
MTVGKASALAAGFVGALALGVAIGPAVHDKWSVDSTPDPGRAAIVTDSAPAETPAKARPRRAPAAAPTRPAAAASGDEFATPRKPAGAVSSVAVAVWEPELRDRVKAVLSPGTKIELAAEDFETPEQFVTVAHAARNTSVPFVLLKHRMLNEGKSLAEAIHELKPELNAKAEVERARDAARSDLAG